MAASVEIIEDHVFGNLRAKIVDITISGSEPHNILNSEFDMDTVLICHIPFDRVGNAYNYSTTNSNEGRIGVTSVGGSLLSTGVEETVRALVIGGAHHAG